MRITFEIDDDEVRRVFGPLIRGEGAIQYQPSAAPRLLTIADLAQRLAVSRSKAYALVARGAIRSVELGRSRRVSEAALLEFVEGPRDAPPIREPSFRSGSVTPTGPPARRSSDRFASIRAAGPEARHSSDLRLVDRQERRDHLRKAPPEIDPSPKPAPTNHRMTDDELNDVLVSLAEHGFPPDLIDEVRQDESQGVSRPHVLSINDSARYLGISRKAVLGLVERGQLRLLTITPAYASEKPVERIPLPIS